MTNDAKRLLGGHLFGTLTEDEARALHRAALEDQEVFDALMDDEPIRDLLADPAARRELLATLEGPSWHERLRAALTRPATWSDLLVAAAALFAVLLVFPPIPRREAAVREAGAPRILLEQLFALAPHHGIPARLETLPPAPNQAASVVFEVGQPSRVLVLEKRADGSIVQLFPRTGEPSRLQAGRVLTVRTSGGPARVRLIVVPPEVDPASLQPGVLPHGLTIVERTIETGGPIQ